MLNEIKDEIKTEWVLYRFQIIGFILLAIPTFILGLMQEWGIGFALLAVILLVDLYLVFLERDTITKWFRRQLPSWADKLIMVGVFVLVVHFTGWGPAYWLTLGSILGHLNWEK